MSTQVAYKVASFKCLDYSHHSFLDSRQATTKAPKGSKRETKAPKKSELKVRKETARLLLIFWEQSELDQFTQGTLIELEDLCVVPQSRGPIVWDEQSERSVALSRIDNPSELPFIRYFEAQQERQWDLLQREVELRRQLQQTRRTT